MWLDRVWSVKRVIYRLVSTDVNEAVRQGSSLNHFSYHFFLKKKKNSCPRPRLHRGGSGRSFSRSNSRNRSTSRAPPHQRTPPSDQRGGSSGHQPMNVALQNGQRTTQTMAAAKGDTQGRPAAPTKTKELHKGENEWEPKAEGTVCTASPERADRVWRSRTYMILKRKKKRPKQKNPQNKTKLKRKLETDVLRHLKKNKKK